MGSIFKIFSFSGSLCIIIFPLAEMKVYFTSHFLFSPMSNLRHVTIFASINPNLTEV